MSNLKFFSTNGHPEAVDFRQALLVGQAPDKGLYMPEKIPQLPLGKVLQFSKMSYPEIAYEVVKPYLGDLVPDEALKEMLQDAYNYEVPVEKVYDGKYVLQIYSGFQRLESGPKGLAAPEAARRLLGAGGRDTGGARHGRLRRRAHRVSPVPVPGWRDEDVRGFGGSPPKPRPSLRVFLLQPEDSSPPRSGSLREEGPPRIQLRQPASLVVSAPRGDRQSHAGEKSQTRGGHERSHRLPPGIGNYVVRPVLHPGADRCRRLLEGLERVAAGCSGRPRTPLVPAATAGGMGDVRYQPGILLRLDSMSHVDELSVHDRLLLHVYLLSCLSRVSLFAAVAALAMPGAVVALVGDTGAGRTARDVGRGAGPRRRST